jgi:hypothetical protein
MRKMAVTVRGREIWTRGKKTRRKDEELALTGTMGSDRRLRRTLTQTEVLPMLPF